MSKQSSTEMASELLACPFCNTAMRIESNRYWHRLIGNHDEQCVFTDEKTMMVPATAEQLELAIRDWNRRAQPAEQHQGELIGRLMRDKHQNIVIIPIGDPHITDGMLVYTNSDSVSGDLESKP